MPHVLLTISVNDRNIKEGEIIDLEDLPER